MDPVEVLNPEKTADYLVAPPRSGVHRDAVEDDKLVSCSSTNGISKIKLLLQNFNCLLK